MMGFSYEKRALKRPRLGPPDVYPQEPKQKEDELTTLNVKHGFTTLPQLSDEFGTARNCNITASKVGAYFNAILTKKEELNTLPDTGRKRQQINPKDNFWPATARTKNAIEAWFKDLAGSKPLSSLSKKAPNFNKKEEIFIMLCEYQVPMLRAAWFIKLSYAYTVAVSEVKIKKRQLSDPSQEWTATLIKFLKDQLNRLQDFYHQSGGNVSGGTASTAANSSSVSTGVVNSSATGGNNAAGNGSSSNGSSTATPVASAGAASSTNTGVNTNAGSSSVQPTAGSTSVPAMTEDQKLAQRQWQFCVQLAKYLYEEGLLERQEFLQWILELLDKMRSSPSDDGILKLLLPLALQYLDEFVQSELLARKLAYLCAKKLAQLCSVATDTAVTNALSSSPALPPSASPQSPLLPGNIILPQSGPTQQTAPVNPLLVTFNEYMSCPHHRDIVLGLSAILQAVTLDCATALVWNCVGEGKSPSVLNGSSLDHLSCAPSTLPMPQRANNPAVRRQLRAAEEHIRNRSRAAEGRWSCDKWQQSSAGRTTSKVLTALDALDRHSFDRMDATNSLDTLYAKIFAPPGTKESSLAGSSCGNTNTTSNNGSNSTVSNSGTNGGDSSRENRADYTLLQDEAVVQILCEWAVSSQRSGEHRAMAVAKLLEKRQSDLMSGEADAADEKDSVSSANGAPTGVPVFQPLLMRFLDNDAPILEDNPTAQNRAMFTNLVHLFSELIRHDIFSHDVYMCTLISRGDLNTGGPAAVASHHPTSNKPATPAESRGPVNNSGIQDDDGSLFPGIDLKPTKLDVQDHGRNMDYDDSKIDDDLDKLLQHIKEEQQNSLDAPDSPKDDGVPPGSLVAAPMASVTPMEGAESGGPGEMRSRHLLYTTHFPLPHDEPGSLHDCNQRHVLLYGVGRVRDEARHTIKKMTKEICKLFSKKFSIDVAEGGKVKKHSRGEFNFEATTAKMQALSYFDQHVVTWQCTVTVVEMLNSFASGSSNYLPVQEHVAFLFDLMELAFSIYDLIDVCIQILKELPEVEGQLQAKGSGLVRSYTTSLSLYVVGVLRRYHCCLLLFPEQTTAVFEGLCRVVKHVTNPGDCSSAERCILAHLYDLYSSCSLLKSKPHCVEPFGNAYPKIRQALYSTVQPSSSNHVCNAQFMADVFSNPRRGGRIEPHWARQLAETPNNRYSFVCNAVVAVCNETDNDRLNDLAILCAELTACCNSLSAEWLGVLMALCCSSNHSSHFIDVLAQVDVQDLSIHNSLAVFTSILIARHCFSLEDFVVHIALPSLVKACNEGRGDADIEAEAGARLTCHLLLRLFKTVECPQPALYSVGTSPHPIPCATSNLGYSIKLSCDRHLLAAAHNNIRVGPVLAVLKEWDKP
ncbi:hypothetical protein B7P43_G16367 [Cryptotermes secundus]|uniref:Mediator complex subunit Med12 domain-containing protein n=1 Tax=Cryptotermes secundus TaxID=105785 RepID=A0A2J7QWT1_9NEOP|nr:hypothetical protein B7P43_G16367 [Cryptotermes secundus]